MAIIEELSSSSTQVSHPAFEPSTLAVLEEPSDSSLVIAHPINDSQYNGSSPTLQQVTPNRNSGERQLTIRTRDMFRLIRTGRSHIANQLRITDTSTRDTEEILDHNHDEIDLNHHHDIHNETDRPHSRNDYAPNDNDDAQDGGTMFSHNSGVSVSGGQFNNVSGDQVNVASATSQFYIFGISQSSPTFQFKHNVDDAGILETTTRWLLSQIRSFDMDVSQLSKLALLLAYTSFQPQLIQFIDSALPQTPLLP